MALDIYQHVTDVVIRQIEKGFEGEAFKPLWHRSGSGMPKNAINQKAYRGINVVLLWIASVEAGCSSARWATYRAWSAAGRQVRKGERSTIVVFWKKLEGRAADDADAQADEDDGTNRPRMVAKAYRVFAEEQLEGYEPPPPPVPLPEDERIQAAELFFNNVPADVTHGGSQAFFVPSVDRIQMPPFEVFRDALAYYSVRGHETVHWTGHQARLNRDFSGRFKSQSYAFEELVAELGATMLSASLGLEMEPRPDHAKYISSWLEVLKGDKRAIMTAASQAQKAVDLLWSFQPEAAAETE